MAEAGRALGLEGGVGLVDRKVWRGQGQWLVVVMGSVLGSRAALGWGRESGEGALGVRLGVGGRAILAS